MPGIGVISNRNARLNKLSPKIKDRLTFIVGRSGEVASTGSLDDAHEAARAFKAAEIDIVAISGGDGTAHRTLELLLEVYGDKPLPPILLLPSGTQNMIPSSFGIRGSSVSNMLLALARYRHNVPLRCVMRNLLKVNDHYSFMFGVGVAPRYLAMYYQGGETTPLGAAKLLGKLILDALRHGTLHQDMIRPIPMEYQLDDGLRRSASFHTLFCSFIEELSLRFRVFPRAGWDRSLFEAVMVDAPALQVACALHRIWAGSGRPIPGGCRTMARRLELRLEQPEPYTLDGEVYPPTDRFTISAGPELRFVVPGFRLRPGNSRTRRGEVGPWEMRFFV